MLLPNVFAAAAVLSSLVAGTPVTANHETDEESLSKRGFGYHFKEPYMMKSGAGGSSSRMQSLKDIERAERQKKQEADFHSFWGAAPRAPGAAGDTAHEKIKHLLESPNFLQKLPPHPPKVEKRAGFRYMDKSPVIRGGNPRMPTLAEMNRAKKEHKQDAEFNAFWASQPKAPGAGGDTTHGKITHVLESGKFPGLKKRKLGAGFKFDRSPVIQGGHSRMPTWSEIKKAENAKKQDANFHAFWGSQPKAPGAGGDTTHGKITHVIESGKFPGLKKRGGGSGWKVFSKKKKPAPPVVQYQSPPPSPPWQQSERYQSYQHQDDAFNSFWKDLQAPGSPAHVRGSAYHYKRDVPTASVEKRGGGAGWKVFSKKKKPAPVVQHESPPPSPPWQVSERVQSERNQNQAFDAFWKDFSKGPDSPIKGNSQFHSYYHQKRDVPTTSVEKRGGGAGWKVFSKKKKPAPVVQHESPPPSPPWQVSERVQSERNQNQAFDAFWKDFSKGPDSPIKGNSQFHSYYHQKRDITTPSVQKRGATASALTKIFSQKKPQPAPPAVQPVAHQPAPVVKQETPPSSPPWQMSERAQSERNQQEAFHVFWQDFSKSPDSPVKGNSKFHDYYMHQKRDGPSSDVPLNKRSDDVNSEARVARVFKA